MNLPLSLTKLDPNLLSVLPKSSSSKIKPYLIKMVIHHQSLIAKLHIISCMCWGPSASEGPQKYN
jgi:hypothetical protein